MIRLDVEVPICCGFQLLYTTSPTITLDTWAGTDGPNRGGLMWMDYLETLPIKFWFGRAAVVDLVKELASSPLNAVKSSAVHEWADAVTVRPSFCVVFRARC